MSATAAAAATTEVVVEEVAEVPVPKSCANCGQSSVPIEAVEVEEGEAQVFKCPACDYVITPEDLASPFWQLRA